MKLTKSELRQIIQEELDSIVGEEIKTEGNTLDPEKIRGPKRRDPTPEEKEVYSQSVRASGREPGAKRKIDWSRAFEPTPHSQSPEAAVARSAMALAGIESGDTAPPPKKRRDTAAPAVASATKSKDTGDDEETNESQDQLYQMVQEELEAVIAERIKQ